MKQIKIKVKGSADQIMDKLADLEVKAKGAKYTQNSVEFVADVTDEDVDGECVVTLNVAKNDAKLQSLLKENLDVTKFFDALDPVMPEEDKEPEVVVDPAENVENFDKVTVDPAKVKAAFKAADKLVKAGKKFKNQEEVVEALAKEAKISDEEAKSALLFFEDGCKLCSTDEPEVITPEEPSEEDESKETMEFSKESETPEVIEKECPEAENAGEEIDFSTLLFSDDEINPEEPETPESEEVDFASLLFDCGTKECECEEKDFSNPEEKENLETTEEVVNFSELLFDVSDPAPETPEVETPEPPKSPEVEEQKPETAEEKIAQDAKEAEVPATPEEPESPENKEEVAPETPEVPNEETKENPEVETSGEPELHADDQFEESNPDEETAEVETFSDPDNELAEESEDEMPTGANAVKKLNERGK